jgi:flagellin
MGFRINTNTASIAAQRALSLNNRATESSLAKLSSGSRITKAADDAAGLAISEKLRSQIRSTIQADRNANDGISMIQVAEGGLNEVQNILTRLRELGIQASSDTVGDTERGFADMEYQQLKMELERIAQVTEFNGTKLLDGSGDIYDFQIGVNNDDFQDSIKFDAGYTNARLDSLELDGLTISDKLDAQGSLDTVDNAIEQVSRYRANLGAIQNRLVSTTQNLQVTNENLQAANSRVRDVDYALRQLRMLEITFLIKLGLPFLRRQMLMVKRP